MTPGSTVRRTRFADVPLTDTFPGAVHSPWSCPACGLLITAHKIARRVGGRGHYLWSAGPDGRISICTPGIPGVFPPPPRR